MSGFSTYLAQKMVDVTLRAQTWTPPATLYLALFTADPTDDNVTANEVAGAWYTRQATGSWSAANPTTNNNQIQFSAVSGGGVTISHWGIYDAVSGGNLLYSDGLTGGPRSLNVGDIFTVAATQLSVTLA